ncbi:tetratricopeptide repeat protein [Pseudomonas silvicola]|nr:tetratricopeptide repeat protein [Pseudomonas silvicola]
MDGEKAETWLLKDLEPDYEGYTQVIFLAKQHPTDLNAQIAAAYACDRAGDEHQAVRFYEIAWALGIPSALRFEFLIGLSSTLRNVGRAQASLDWLEKLSKEHPENAALAAFMALTLHALGQTELALAMMLEAALKAGDGKGLAPYTRALTEYRNGLSATGSSATV